MQKTIEQYMANEKLNKEIFRRRAAAALLLSIFVIIGVFWWLKLVGITLAGDAFCGNTEHVHSEECMAEVLTCTLTEGALQADGLEHVHDEKCCEPGYVCGLNEHIHIASCYSDSSADTETSEVWEKTLEEVALGWDVGDNLTAVAASQLGYTESAVNYQVDEQGIRRGYSRYGEWYGNPYGEWNAMFVSFCLHYSGISSEQLPYYSGAETMRMEWETLQVYQPVGVHTPEPGDILFWDEDGNGKADGVGILSVSSEDTYTVIAGDREDSVRELELSKTDPAILGAAAEVRILACMADETVLARAEEISAMIDALPSFETVAQTLSEYEINEDYEGYEAYFAQVAQESLEAYTLWEDLGMFQPLVHNAERLEYYQSLWVSTLAAVSAPTVYQINSYKSGSAATLLVSGSGKVRDIMGTGMSYTYWDLYLIGKDSAGYYVKEINLNDVAKLDHSPGDGFILLMNGDSWSGVTVGDRISVNFTITGTHAYKAAGYGTVSIVEAPPEIVENENNNLTPIQSADTMNLIYVDLFNYGDLINTKYNSNKNYPGFQQEYGTPSIGTNLTSGSFNFGNNITADLDAGINGVTNQGGDINTTANSANTPISGVMNYTLGADGYPAVKYTANGFDPSLKWLFTTNAATSTVQMNTSNINGLFLQDEETGRYYFDSRLNYAWYNEEKNVFELYDELLTPNYIMYPFGNFLPFNNINTQATHVPTITNQYFTRIADRARARLQNGMRSEYGTLSDVLNTFVTKMGSTFTYLDAVDAYFEKAGVPGGGTAGAAIFNGMYNLDYDIPSDFYFGMKIKINFLMPKDGTTGPKGDQPLIFDFNGDDDVWVYVDGKLFLDLSGIHRHVGGRIDFQQGRVMFYEFNKETGLADQSIPATDPVSGQQLSYVNDKGETVYYVPFSTFLGTTQAQELNEKGTFKNFSEHTIDFFYMERGSGSSVCNIEFNLPLIPDNSIAVTKELDLGDEIDTIGNPDFYFQILKADAQTPFIEQGVEYSILDASTQLEIGKGITGENGVFSIKANQTAVFSDIPANSGQYFVRELLDPTVFEQYGTVTVDGVTTTRDAYQTDVTIGETAFVGVDSSIKDIGDGNTAFLFTNHVDAYEYGSLKLSKTYHDYQNGSEPKDVTFEILLDGTPIPADTPYTVIKADQTAEARAITQDGKLTFRSDETVLFEKILAGSRVLLREAAQSSKGYEVTFTSDEAFAFSMVSDGEDVYGEGIIPSAQLAVAVNNDLKGAKVTIPVTKTLLYPDGEEHSFTFVLQQVKGPEDLTADGICVKTPLTISEGVAELAFTINYVPDTADGKYYYLVYEENASGTNGMDTTQYLVEVTLAAAEGETTAEITGCFLADGTPLTATEPLGFTNSNVRSLTVEKQVQSVVTDQSFTFTVHAGLNGKYVNGIYECTGNSEITQVEFINGAAEFTLKDRQSLTIHNLPYGVTWMVTESPADGFYSKYEKDGEIVLGDEVTGVLLANDQVKFINIGGYELPSTGSYAALWCAIAGITMMLLALILGYILRCRLERRFK